MRISDWSSDVCSSDLNDREQPIESLIKDGPLIKMGVENPCLFVNGVISTQRLTNIHLLAIKVILHPKVLIKLQPILLDIILQDLIEEWGCRRSDERSVGKECVSTGRTRGSPKKNKKK